jgi:hypothetical protein
MEKNKKIKILLGLTTTPGSDWRGKAKECKKFNIQEIALFVTSIDIKERKELYELLENSPVKSIPHVHLRTDMKKEELDYLVKKFKTKVFNIHSVQDVHKFSEYLGEHTSNVYVENSPSHVPYTKEFEKYGGVCIDFSHWEDSIMRGRKEIDLKMKKAIKKFKVGCSHISAVGSEIHKMRDAKFPEIIYEDYSKHTFSNLSEFDYIKKFIKYLPALVSLELENSFSEQVEVKKYLENIIDDYQKSLKKTVILKPIFDIIE